MQQSLAGWGRRAELGGATVDEIKKKYHAIAEEEESENRENGRCSKKKGRKDKKKDKKKKGKGA